jgi:hypothetical protein
MVVLERLEDGAVAVQEGLFAVGAGSGSGGGASVDIGDAQAYLHELTALSRSGDGFWTNRFYSGAPFPASSLRF